MRPAQSVAFNMELGEPNVLKPPLKLENVDDIYEAEFYRRPHMNFIGVSSEREKGEPVHEIISVLREPEKDTYRALRTTRKRSEKMFIASDDLTAAKTQHAQFSKHLNKLEAGADYYYVRDEGRFASDLLRVEKKHAQKVTGVKFAVVFSTPESPGGKGNSEGSEAFSQFLACLGDKIDLGKWTGYRGDFGRDVGGETYFTHFEGVDVMFHVSTMLNAEQHRRLIGNDIGVILFSERPIDPGTIDLGTVPQVFGVVCPAMGQVGEDYADEGQLYQLGFFSRKSLLRTFGPAVPGSRLFREAFDEMRSFLLCKMINGHIAALQSPPMNRLFYLPRGAFIEDLVRQYPVESSAAASQRERKAAEARRQLRLPPSDGGQAPRSLGIVVRQADKIPSMDSNGLADPFVVVRLQEQEARTATHKKTLQPVWNETFKFDLRGVPYLHTQVEFVVNDWNQIGAADCIGVAYVPLVDIESDREVTLQLRPRAQDHGKVAPERGNLKVKFVVTGGLRGEDEQKVEIPQGLAALDRIQNNYTMLPDADVRQHISRTFGVTLRGAPLNGALDAGDDVVAAAALLVGKFDEANVHDDDLMDVKAASRSLESEAFFAQLRRGAERTEAAAAAPAVMERAASRKNPGKRTSRSSRKLLSELSQTSLVPMAAELDALRGGSSGNVGAKSRLKSSTGAAGEPEAASGVPTERIVKFPSGVKAIATGMFAKEAPYEGHSWCVVSVPGLVQCEYCGEVLNGSARAAVQCRWCQVLCHRGEEGHLEEMACRDPPRGHRRRGGGGGTSNGSSPLKEAGPGIVRDVHRWVDLTSLRHVSAPLCSCDQAHLCQTCGAVRCSEFCPRTKEEAAQNRRHGVSSGDSECRALSIGSPNHLTHHWVRWWTVEEGADQTQGCCVCKRVRMIEENKGEERCSMCLVWRHLECRGAARGAKRGEQCAMVQMLQLGAIHPSLVHPRSTLGASTTGANAAEADQSERSGWRVEIGRSGNASAFYDFEVYPDSRTENMPAERTKQQRIAMQFRPLLVLYDPQVAPDRAKLWVRLLSSSLLSAQIVDVSKTSVYSALKGWKEMASVMRVVVLGDDRTLSWCCQEAALVWTTLGGNADGGGEDGLDDEDKIPPMALLPLAAGNDLSGALGFGVGPHAAVVHGQSGVVAALRQVVNARSVLLDTWRVKVMRGRQLGRGAAPKVGGSKDVRVVSSVLMQCYFSIGLDAQATLRFRQVVDAQLGSLTARSNNGKRKLWEIQYPTTGRVMAGDECSRLSEVAHVVVDGKVVSIAGMQGVIVLNVQSYAGGLDLWGAERVEGDAARNQGSTGAPGGRGGPWNSAATHADGVFEVVGVRSLAHLAEIQHKTSYAVRLAQGRRITVQFHPVDAMSVACQVDGHPWVQQGRGVLSIAAEKKVRVLSLRAPQDPLVRVTKEGDVEMRNGLKRASSQNRARRRSRSSSIVAHKQSLDMAKAAAEIDEHMKALADAADQPGGENSTPAEVQGSATAAAAAFVAGLKKEPPGMFRGSALAKQQQDAGETTPASAPNGDVAHANGGGGADEEGKSTEERRKIRESMKLKRASGEGAPSPATELEGDTVTMTEGEHGTLRKALAMPAGELPKDGQSQANGGGGDGGGDGEQSVVHRFFLRRDLGTYWTIRVTESMTATRVCDDIAEKLGMSKGTFRLSLLGGRDAKQVKENRCPDDMLVFHKMAQMRLLIEQGLARFVVVEREGIVDVAAAETDTRKAEDAPRALSRRISLTASDLGGASPKGQRRSIGNIFGRKNRRSRDSGGPFSPTGAQ